MIRIEAKKFGGSLMLRIPHDIAEYHNIVSGTMYELTVDKKNLIFSDVKQEE